MKKDNYIAINCKDVKDLGSTCRIDIGDSSIYEINTKLNGLLKLNKCLVEKQYALFIDEYYNMHICGKVEKELNFKFDFSYIGKFISKKYVSSIRVVDDLDSFKKLCIEVLNKFNILSMFCNYAKMKTDTAYKKIYCFIITRKDLENIDYLSELNIDDYIYYLGEFCENDKFFLIKTHYTTTKVIPNCSESVAQLNNCYLTTSLREAYKIHDLGIGNIIVIRNESSLQGTCYVVTGFDKDGKPEFKLYDQMFCDKPRNVFIIMGKSNSGKDSLVKQIRLHFQRLTGVELNNIVMYTTRPKRDNEVDGVDYHFVDNQYMEDSISNIIDLRTYTRIDGKYSYFLLKDQFLKYENSLVINTLVGASNIIDTFENDNIKFYPIYIECDDKNILKRYMNRIEHSDSEDYAEICRRFISDKEDFSEESIKEFEEKHSIEVIRISNNDWFSGIFTLMNLIKDTIEGD